MRSRRALLSSCGQHTVDRHGHVHVHVSGSDAMSVGCEEGGGCADMVSGGASSSAGGGGEATRRAARRSRTSDFHRWLTTFLTRWAMSDIRWMAASRSGSKSLGTLDCEQGATSNGR
eukprot:4862385-Prymnesium_polylepis.1